MYLHCHVYYGADSLRRTRTANGVTTYYVYDGSMLVREMKQNAQGVLQSTATYLCGPRGPEYRRDDTQAEGTYSDSTGTHPAGKTRWYVYDGLGSVVGEVDPSGNLTSSGTFDVYGAKRQGGTGTATSRQGFVGSLGHVSDSETGMVYMRARYYDPNVGRFESEDPGYNGLNWFSYCNNNPIGLVDQNGKDPLGITFMNIVDSLLSSISGGGYALPVSRMLALANADGEAAAMWLRQEADDIDGRAHDEFLDGGADFATEKELDTLPGCEGAAATAGVNGKNHEVAGLEMIFVAYQLRLMAQDAAGGGGIF